MQLQLVNGYAVVSDCSVTPVDDVPKLQSLEDRGLADQINRSAADFLH